MALELYVIVDLRAHLLQKRDRLEERSDPLDGLRGFEIRKSFTCGVPPGAAYPLKSGEISKARAGLALAAFYFALPAKGSCRA